MTIINKFNLFICKLNVINSFSYLLLYNLFFIYSLQFLESSSIFSFLSNIVYTHGHVVDQIWG